MIYFPDMHDFDNFADRKCYKYKGVGTLRAKIGPISEMKQTLKNENTRFTECKSV